jgi:hypothetical protein
VIDFLGNLGAIDWRDPVDRAHAQNSGRLLWWLATPANMGSPAWLDMMRGVRGTLNSFGFGYGLRATPRPGGRGELRFNGSSSVVALPAGLPAPVRWTFGAWIRSGLTGSQPVVARFGGAYLIRHTTTNILSYVDQWGADIAGTALAANVWYRALVTGNPTTVRIYLNNILAGSGATTAANQPALAEIGGYQGIAQDFWDGSLDSVTLYGREFTAAEVADDYDLERRGLPDVLNRVGPTVFWMGPPPPPVVGTLAVGDTFHFGAAYAGLGASVGYTVTDAAGTGVVRIARRNQGVTEVTDYAGGGTGNYSVAFDAPPTWTWPLRVHVDITGRAGVALESMIGTDFALSRAAVPAGPTDANLVRVLGAPVPPSNVAGYLSVDVVKVAGDDADTLPDPTALDPIAVESGLNARQALAVIVSAVVGQLSGATAGGGTIVTKTPDGATTRATVTTDAQGNRSAVTLNPPA